MNDDREFCLYHQGHEERLKTLERNIVDLWHKWDKMQLLLLGIFITLSLNLLGVIILMVKASAAACNTDI